MTSVQFIELARRMRKAQREYYSTNAKMYPEKKQHLLIVSKQLEREFDMADIEDPANLEIDFPKAEES